jgi:hypothetical protein
VRPRIKLDLIARVLTRPDFRAGQRAFVGLYPADESPRCCCAGELAYQAGLPLSTLQFIDSYSGNRTVETTARWQRELARLDRVLRTTYGLTPDDRTLITDTNDYEDDDEKRVATVLARLRDHVAELEAARVWQ